jgi:hypothetical protein
MPRWRSSKTKAKPMMKNMNPDRTGIYLKFSGFNPVCNYANQLASTKKKPDKNARAQGIEVCSFCTAPHHSPAYGKV